MKEDEKSSFFGLISIILFLSLFSCILFVKYYIYHEEPLYYWDYAGYWFQFKEYGAIAQKSLTHFFSMMFRSIQDSSYSGAPILPLIPVYKLFGGSRDSYISAISILYLVPSAYIISAISTLHLTTKEYKPITLGICFFFALLFTPFWAPTLRGYISIGGLIPLGLAAMIILKTRFLTKATLVQTVSAGIALWASFLFRRWYAPSVIAIVCASSIFSIGIALANSYKIKETVSLVKNYIILFITGAILGLSFQYPLLLRIISTSYSKRFSAYSAPFLYILENLYDNLGLLACSLIFLGIISAFIKKNYVVLFTIFVAVLITIIFSSIQAPGLQQQLPIMFMLFPALFSGVFFITNGLRNKSILLLLMVLSFLTFFFSFVPGQGNDTAYGKFLFPHLKYPPLSIEHFKNYVALDHYLQSITNTSDKKFSVFAASSTLNSSLLVAIDSKLGDRINWEADIDRRDHFHWQTLRSKYVVVGNPIQLQFSKKFQEVIFIPAKDILTHTSIGSDYKRISPFFKLANKDNAAVYERMHPFSKGKISDFAKQLYKYYPSWKQYDNDQISMELASAKVVLGKKWGEVQEIGKNEIFMSPGINTATSVKLNTASGYLPRKITLRIPSDAKRDCPNTHGVLAKVLAGNSLIDSGIVTPGHTIVAEMPSSYSNLSVSVSPIINPNCDWVHVTFSGG